MKKNMKKRMKKGLKKELPQGNAAQRAVALVAEYYDVMERIENVPVSPVRAFMPPQLRRRLRRDAARLRKGQAEPRYGNLHSAEQLAEHYERAVERDEILAQAIEDCKRITRELVPLLEDPEAKRAMGTMVLEAERLAEEEGPGSEADRRYQRMRSLVLLGRHSLAEGRRKREILHWNPVPSHDPTAEARFEASAAEILDAPPPGEAVIAIPPIPPDGSGAGGRRLFIRIGVREAAWIGSFERGHMKGSTVRMLPDRRHLLVAADGAGYVIEAETRTLVETIGTEVAGFMADEPPTLFIVNHGGRRLEAFGTSGRLWKTEMIGFGFREMGVDGDHLLGETLLPYGPAWTPFSVEIATGRVRVGGGAQVLGILRALPSV
jgi:hypothetical protein